LYGVDFNPNEVNSIVAWIPIQLKITSDIGNVLKILSFAKAAKFEELSDWLETYLTSEKEKNALSNAPKEQLFDFISLIPLSPNNLDLRPKRIQLLLELLDKAVDLDGGPEVIAKAISTRYMQGETALHFFDFCTGAFPLLEKLATKKNGAAIVKELLSKRLSNGYTPLHRVALPKDLPNLPKSKLPPTIIAHLLSMEDNLGNTPLHKNVEVFVEWLKVLPPEEILRLLNISNKNKTTPLGITLTNLHSVFLLAKEIYTDENDFLMTWLTTPDKSGATPLRTLAIIGAIPQDMFEELFDITDFDPEPDQAIREDHLWAPGAPAASESFKTAIMSWVSSRQTPEEITIAIQFLMALGYIPEAREHLLANITLVDQLSSGELATMLLSQDLNFPNNESVLLNPEGFDRVLPLLEVLAKRERGSALARGLLMVRNSEGNPPIITTLERLGIEDISDYSRVLDWLEPDDARMVLQQSIDDSNVLKNVMLTQLTEPGRPVTFLNEAILKKLYNVNFDPDFPIFTGLQPDEVDPVLNGWAGNAMKLAYGTEEEKINKCCDIILFCKALGLNFHFLLNFIPFELHTKLYEHAHEELRTSIFLLNKDLKPAHIKAGARIDVPVPQPIAMTSSQFIGAEQKKYSEFYSFIADCLEGADKELSLTPQTKEALLEWEEKIRGNEKFDGLSEDENTRKKEYQDYCCYVTHIVNAYKIGQHGGDREAKLGVLNNIADMQPNCFPRWKKEILIAYIYRPRTAAEIAIEGPQSLPTMQDRILQRLRTQRIGILSQDMLTYGGNVHEPNYLLDIFREELDTRLDPSGDAFVARVAVNYPKNRAQLFAEFNRRYNKYDILEGLLAHLRAQQSKTRASKDPLDLSPAAVQDFLVETYGTSWKQEEYDQVAEKARLMEKKLATTGEIAEFLDNYGIDWLPEENVESACVRLNTRVNMLKRLKEPPEEPAKLQAIQEQLEGKSKSQQRDILLANRLMIPGKQLEEVLTLAAIKRAQINKFMSTEVFEGGEDDPSKSRFTREAAFYLLRASGVL